MGVMITSKVVPFFPLTLKLFKFRYFYCKRRLLEPLIMGFKGFLEGQEDHFTRNIRKDGSRKNYFCIIHLSLVFFVKWLFDLLDSTKSLRSYRDPYGIV